MWYFTLLPTHHTWISLNLHNSEKRKETHRKPLRLDCVLFMKSIDCCFSQFQTKQELRIKIFDSETIKKATAFISSASNNSTMISSTISNFFKTLRMNSHKMSAGSLNLNCLFWKKYGHIWLKLFGLQVFLRCL